MKYLRLYGGLNLSGSIPGQLILPQTAAAGALAACGGAMPVGFGGPPGSSADKNIKLSS